MNKVSIITLGCKQNKYESDCMARILSENGYTVTENLEFADIYILNTCAVTSEAEKKSRQHIVKFNKLNPACRIIVCGCASEKNKDQFIDKPNVKVVFGTEGKERILEYVQGTLSQGVPTSKVYASPIGPIKSTTREYVKIQDGCNNFCSYCIIPYLRGRSRSRDLDDIVHECEIIANRSHEIVLTGIDISSYSIDGKPALHILMDRLSHVNALIRLGSLEVGVITEEFMQILSNMPNFAPHFHLSLQSGDDDILKLMNRHYTAEEFYKRVLLIRKYFPDCNLTTDVIVGFGNESEAQFENTKEFIKKVGFSFVHIFPYSRRAGTRAYTFPDLTMAIKKQRVDELEEVNNILKVAYLEKFIGRESVVLIEEKKDFFEGFSPEYIRCYTDENVESGHLYRVKFTGIYDNGMKVKILKEV